MILVCLYIEQEQTIIIHFWMTRIRPSQHNVCFVHYKFTRMLVTGVYILLVMSAHLHLVPLSDEAP